MKLETKRFKLNNTYISHIKLIKYISLYLAGLLIVLHSLLPHEHDELIQEVDVTLSEPEIIDFLSFVKNIFLQDLGEDHLENIQVSDGNQIAHFDIKYNTLPLAILSDLFQLETHGLQFEARFYPEYEVPIKTRLFYPGGTLRGPPYIA